MKMTSRSDIWKETTTPHGIRIWHKSWDLLVDTEVSKGSEDTSEIEGIIIKCTINLRFTWGISSGQYEVIVFVPLMMFKNGSRKINDKRVRELAWSRLFVLGKNTSRFITYISSHTNPRGRLEVRTQNRFNLMFETRFKMFLEYIFIWLIIRKLIHYFFQMASNDHWKRRNAVTQNQHGVRLHNAERTNTNTVWLKNESWKGAPAVCATVRVSQGCLFQNL